jgi:hypothetical protein
VELSKEGELTVGHRRIDEDVTREHTLVETSIHDGEYCILGCCVV